ncbi:MAG: DUF1080 domain-containing protein [Verrucomicrobia bacterium]|nr:DUF1080 domain-containing protein [Verrucomicrobiota bacterium]
MKSRFSLLFGTFLTAALALGAQPAAPITPREVIPVFNGKDLSNFTTWETVHGRQDPDRVFTVVDQIDGAPAIRCSGQHYGGIVTKDSYTQYRLVVEFRWGLLTWAPRKDRARDSGILLHCQGEEGNAAKTFNSPWMRSVEFQIIEGGTGDVILVNGYDRDQPAVIAPTMKTKVTPGTRRWNPAGADATYTVGRIDWLRRDPDWKDVLGFRGRADAEKPPGQWNRLEAICDGGNITYFVNGEKVMEGWDGSFTAGKLLFQSEGAEIFFRKIELHPLAK